MALLSPIGNQPALMDNLPDVKTLRERATECRALAEVAQNEGACNDLMQAALIYEAMAAQLEALARRPMATRR